MNKPTSIIVTLGLVVGMGIIFIGGSNDNTNTGLAQSVEIRDGVQYITINAKGGYFPPTTEAKSGLPTKLIMRTNGTYDCSASLVIRSVGYQQILPQTGVTEIDLGTPKTGVPLRGVCGMGMYSFQ